MAKTQHTQRKKSVNELRFIKKCQNHTFKVNFRCKKSTKFFQKKIIWKYQFGRPFSVKNILFKFNFWTTLFSKIIPNFWQIGAPGILKIQWFPLSILIFGQKSCFFGPTIFKIPQPNWYYMATANTGLFSTAQKKMYSSCTQGILSFIKFWVNWLENTLAWLKYTCTFSHFSI